MMDFDEIIVKESPGLCRCCLSEGCYKDLSTEYSWMSDTEIYADMLLECFDISISQHIEGPNGPNRLICEVCITRLRDACNFKKQVLDSEKKFVDMLGRGEFQPKVVIYETPLKNEEMVEETLAEDVEVEYLEDDMDFGDDLPLRPATVEPSISNITVDALKVKGKRGRPKKSTAIKTEKKAKVPKLDDKPRTSKAVSKGQYEHDETVEDIVIYEMATEDAAVKVEINIEDTTDHLEITRNHRKAPSRNQRKEENQLIMNRNVLEVLLRSTVMPFQCTKHSYICFYCYDVFNEPEELKAHSETHTDEYDIREAMSKYTEPVVLVEVSNLSCKLCDVKLNDLTQLIHHLISEHDVEFYNDDFLCNMCPFKLTGVSIDCVECGISIETFQNLVAHINLYHRGTTDVLCDLCGLYFGSQPQLTDHISKKHNNGPVKCPKCGIVIKKQTLLRTHMQNVHNKRYKCVICSETFESYYKRLRHMISVHDYRETVTCPRCPRTFFYKSVMIRHLRETHLQEKNASCPICGFQAFETYTLQRHMMKHTNEKNFQCSECDGLFKSRLTLNRHIRKFHEDTSNVIVEEEEHEVTEDMLLDPSES